VHSNPSLLKDAWDNAVAGAAVIALALGAWISVRTLGLLNRPKYWLRSTYLPPHDLVGFFAMPHFMVEYENRGNTPVTFSDFMLILPRIDGLIDGAGRFVLHPGAELLIDKRPTTRIAAFQSFSKIDYRTAKVRLEPQEMHTDYFDLGAFFPEAKSEASRWKDVKVPTDFHPVMSFHDNFGNSYYCDNDGLHEGRWEPPHLDALRAAGARIGFSQGLQSRRRLLHWLGWTSCSCGGLGEPPELALPKPAAQ
jgi:hypothetical protein